MGNKIGVNTLLKQFSNFLGMEQFIQQKKNYDISMLLTGRDLFSDDGTMDIAGMSTHYLFYFK